MKNYSCFLVFIAFSVCGFSQFSAADSFYNAGKWKEAIHLYEQHLQSFPNDRPGFHWNRIGQSYFSLQDWKNAIDAYKKAAVYGNPTVLYNLACAYARNNEKDSALAWLERSATAGFTQYQGVSSDEDLKSLQDDVRLNTIISKMKKNAMPCSFQPESQQFNFWIGHWKVFNLQGQQAGSSVIEQILGECVIQENWTDFFGNKGKSFNFYNSADKIWQQTWVDDKGSVTEFIDGKYEDGAMRFKSSRPVISPVTNKNAVRRLTFFNIGPNEVRQFGERSDDDGKTWQTEYDLKYVREQ